MVHVRILDNIFQMYVNLSLVPKYSRGSQVKGFLTMTNYEARNKYPQTILFECGFLQHANTRPNRRRIGPHIRVIKIHAGVELKALILPGN